MSHASLSVALLVDRPVLLSDREVIVVDELLAQLYNIGEKKRRKEERNGRIEKRGKRERVPSRRIWRMLQL